MKTPKTGIEITEIVKRHGGSQSQFAANPTWFNKEKQEGFDIIMGVVRSFFVKDSERIYGEAPSQPWQAVIDEVMSAPEKKTEQISATAAPGHEGIVPDTLTKALIEKWAGMKTFERMLMFQNTPEDMIETRPGPGGSKLKYVKGNKMIQELNIAFLFNWSSHIEEVKETDTGYWVRGYITVEADNVSITRAAIGTADKHKGVNSEDVAKAAAMDMVKKAASSLGFNGDVYRGEV